RRRAWPLVAVAAAAVLAVAGYLVHDNWAQLSEALGGKKAGPRAPPPLKDDVGGDRMVNPGRPEGAGEPPGAPDSPAAAAPAPAPAAETAKTVPQLAAVGLD